MVVVGLWVQQQLRDGTDIAEETWEMAEENRKTRKEKTALKFQEDRSIQEDRSSKEKTVSLELSEWRSNWMMMNVCLNNELRYFIGDDGIDKGKRGVTHC